MSLYSCHKKKNQQETVQKLCVFSLCSVVKYKELNHRIHKVFRRVAQS